MPAEPRPWLLSQVQALPPLPGPSFDDIRAGLADPDRERAETLRRDLVRGESIAWAERMLMTEAPFAERWAQFWGNHLAISRRNGIAAAFSGHYHRAAIRPHVFGRFDDLMLAAYRHPAMLAYLDQAGSIGPNSRAGRRRNAGLNENLARECLELHSITPAAGYGQDDVGALARLLTGWSIGRGITADETAGFLFRPNAHEPGAKTLMGHDYSEGSEGAEAALRWLANHPATRHALAMKLARHFVADVPPSAAIARIEAALRPHGDLAAAARAIIAEPSAWLPLAKVRHGQDYALAVMRGLGLSARAAPNLLGIMGRLNQPLWTPPAPIGWPDDAASWAVPEQLMRRVDWANELAARGDAGQRLPLPELLETLLGPLARAETVTAARRAGSAQEAVLLVLASPEAQRR